ncbi:hypothetical protein MLD38_008107 [Melastoma candidum]|uniref:Uncharacterized protein n=1 Tax=Melastoma candidum TaxID=119954 RepID=A0ACB9S1T0_9MYRT|nr:hypothetical protein MLD38_008107 [Melastoma candidum]
MDFSLPLERYKSHNLVVHGWPSLVFGERKSWTSINAGVFLIRNCQWSMDFLELWASAGPQGKDYEGWGETLRGTFKDKIFEESDDQSMLIYLILKNEMGSRDKMALDLEVKELRRRHAEKVSEHYGELRHKLLRDAGEGYGKGGLSRPFVTHFTGCQPCSGEPQQEVRGGVLLGRDGEGPELRGQPGSPEVRVRPPGPTEFRRRDGRAVQLPATEA